MRHGYGNGRLNRSFVKSLGYVSYIGLVGLVGGVGMTGAGVSSARDSWAVAHGAGSPGIYRVTREAKDNCRTDCGVLGDFTPSDTGQQVPYPVPVQGDLHVHRIGERAAGVYYRDAVYPPHDGDGWHEGAVIAGVGAAGALLSGWLLVRRWRLGRREAAPVPAAAQGRGTAPRAARR